MSLSPLPTDGHDGTVSLVPVILPAVITIATVEALADSLKQLSFPQPALILDAAQTEMITTPGAQLLLALAKTLSARGIGLAIANQKPAFTQALEQLGMKTQLTEWEESRWLKQS